VVQEKVRYLAHILDKEREPFGQKISFPFQIGLEEGKFSGKNACAKLLRRALSVSMSAATRFGTFVIALTSQVIVPASNLIECKHFRRLAFR
jgi:hypothetical protein